MAERQVHLAQAERNLSIDRLLSARDQPESRQWQLVVRFYAVVHLIEAELASFSHHSRNHEHREVAMTRLQPLRPLVLLYRRLRSDSENVRYGCWLPGEPDVEANRLVLAQIAAGLGRSI
jgi:hypothetical protein